MADSTAASGAAPAGRGPLAQLRSAPARTQALVLIVAFTLLRLATTALMGMGTDESYTVSISREFALSYFDHPPLHQWIVWAFQGLWGTSRAARLPFVAIAAGTSWLMFLLARRLFGDRAAVWAVLALNLSVFFGVVSAWVLPDGPLNLCLLGATLALSGVFLPDATRPARPWRDWLAAGVWIGLAALSKYQAVLFCVGLLAFVLTAPGRWRTLLHPAPWIAAVLALVILSPVVIWNAQHHWISFAFQAGRGAAKHGLHPDQVLTSILGQAGVLTPWVAVPLGLAGWRAAKAGPSDDRRWYLLMLAAPAIVIFTFSPLWGDKGLPHWAMPGWLLLFPALGALLADAAVVGRRWPWRWGVISTVLLLVLWAAFMSDAPTAWMRRAFHLKTDPTAETIEWTPLRAEVLRRKQAPSRCLFVASVSWIEAGKIGQAVGDLAPVRVLSDDPRGFGFLELPPSLQGCDALVIARPSRKAAKVRPEDDFAEVRPYDRLRFGRGGQDEVDLVILDARGLRVPLRKLD